MLLQDFNICEFIFKKEKLFKNIEFNKKMMSTPRRQALEHTRLTLLESLERPPLNVLELDLSKPHRSCEQRRRVVMQ